MSPIRQNSNRDLSPLEAMPPEKRAKEQDSEAEEPSQKKKRKPPDEPDYISIHLDSKTRSALSLTNKEILRIWDITYLSSITNRMSYIYDIVARVCGCPVEAVFLYRQSDGELRGEKDEGWEMVDWDTDLESGDYLCNCKEGPVLSITLSD